MEKLFDFNYTAALQLLISAVNAAIIMLIFPGINSISESWYRFKKENKWIFTAFCVSVGALSMFGYIPYGYKPGTLSIFAVSGLFLVLAGNSPAFKSNKLVNFVHYVGATVCITLDFVALIYETRNYFPVLVFLALWGSFKFIARNNVFLKAQTILYVEIFAILVITHSLFFINWLRNNPVWFIF